MRSNEIIWGQFRKWLITYKYQIIAWNLPIWNCVQISQKPMNLTYFKCVCCVRLWKAVFIVANHVCPFLSSTQFIRNFRFRPFIDQTNMQYSRHHHIPIQSYRTGFVFKESSLNWWLYLVINFDTNHDCIFEYCVFYHWHCDNQEPKNL